MAALVAEDWTGDRGGHPLEIRMRPETGEGSLGAEVVATTSALARGSSDRAAWSSGVPRTAVIEYVEMISRRDRQHPSRLKQSLLAGLQLSSYVANIIHQETKDEISIDWRRGCRRDCFRRFCTGADCR